MCPPAGLPLGDIHFDCTSEEVIMRLQSFQHGHPLPSNVIAGVNPYCQRPEFLASNGKLWYFVSSVKEENKRSSDDGIWKANGEPALVYSSDSIIGSKTDLEFFEGETSLCQKRTDWIMQEFKITQSEENDGLDESKVHEHSALCRVFRSAEEDPNDHVMRFAFGDTDSSNKKDPLPLPLLISTESRYEKGSTSNHQEKDQSGKAIEEFPPDGPDTENAPDNDYISRGDFLELWDLGSPGSPSSSSDNSSCVTISSNECFDSLALLQDLEANVQNGESRGVSDHPVSASSFDQQSRAITTIAASGSLIIDERRNFPDQGRGGTDNPSSSTQAKGKEKKRGSMHRNPSSTSTSTSNEGSTSRESSDSEGTKKHNSRMKRLKKKYLCGLPFMFLF